MALSRYAAGGALLVFSTLGLLLCLAGIVAAWGLLRPAGNLTAALFTAADEALEFAGTRIDRAHAAVQQSRRRLSAVPPWRQRLQAATSDVKPDELPLRETLEELLAALKAAESWLESSRAAAQGIARLSALAASSRADAADDADSRGIALAQRLEELSQQVARDLDKLQALRQELVETAEKGLVAKELALRLVAALAGLDQRLSGLGTQLKTCESRVLATRSSLARGHRRIDRLLVAAATGVSIVLLWFGVSQLGMLQRGWTAVRRARPSAAPGAFPEP